MEGVPENALQPLYFVAEMLDTETSQLAGDDTQTCVFQPAWQRGSMVFVKKCAAELVRRRGVATLVFRIEKRLTPTSFSTIVIVEHTVIVQNRKV